MRLAATVVATALLVLAVDITARADTCETFPGSQVYTDQNCDKPYENNKPAPKQAAPAQGQQNRDLLREQLRKNLSGSGSGAANGGAKPPSADQINQRVVDARAKIDAALADPKSPGAQQRYDAAMKDLHGAYADAAKAYPNQADLFQRFESQDQASASARAADAGWDAPATVDATPAKPAGPDNVTAVGDKVYVCDGAIAGANNVSCREIAADGQCTGVTLADGGAGWHDSIATPCHPNDLTQRQNFLAANPDAAAGRAAAPPGFAMDSQQTAAEIKRLLADPPPRAVDAGEKSDWQQAMADPTAPTVNDAEMATPMTMASNDDSDDDGDGGSNLDDAIDFLNAASSLLGAASGVASSHGSSVHTSGSTVRTSTITRSAPSVTYHPPPVVQGCTGTYVCSAK